MEDSGGGLSVVHQLIKLNESDFPAADSNCCNIPKLILFLLWSDTRLVLGKPCSSWQCHSIPAGNREVTVAFNFISGRTVLSQNSAGQPRKTTKKPTQYIRSTGRYFSPGRPDFEAGMLAKHSAKNMEMTAFWVIALCSLVYVDRRFRDAYYFHHHGNCLE
jgi:hypothetical protein